MPVPVPGRAPRLICALALWAVCGAALSAQEQPATPTPAIAVLAGTIQLQWPASARAAVYRVLRCPTQRDSGGFTLSCPDAVADTCKGVGNTAQTSFTESPPKAAVFCYHVQACGDEAGGSCSVPSKGLIGFNKPPHKVALRVDAPEQVRPGDEVLMSSQADSAGTVTEYRWAQEGTKDILPEVVMAPQVRWVAPQVSQPTTFRFKAMAEDDYGTRDFKSVAVVVVPQGMVWQPAPPQPRAPRSAMQQFLDSLKR